jgi:hypothetical protein
VLSRSREKPILAAPQSWYARRVSHKMLVC